MSATKYSILLTIPTLLLGLLGWLGSQTAPLQAAAPQAATPAATRQPATGRFQFANNELARTGSFTLEISSLATPPAGNHYELWLRADNGGSLLDLGAVKVTNQRVNFTGHTAQPLLNTHNTLLMSLEADNKKGTTISQQLVVSTTLPPPFLTPMRQLFFPGKANDKGFLAGAEEQIEIALKHSGFLDDAINQNNFADVQRHTEHIVNILDGKDGFLYGDLNRDGQIQNPGDGFGIRAYLEGAEATVVTATTVLTATADKDWRTQAQLARTASEEGRQLVGQASETALQIFASDTITEAQKIAINLGMQLAKIKADIDSASAASLQMATYHFTPVIANTPGVGRAPGPRNPPPAPTATLTQTLVATKTEPATQTTTVSTQTAILIPTATATPAATENTTATVSAAPTLMAFPTPVTISATTTLTPGELWLNPVDGAEYVYVPGGEFTMGAEEYEAASPLEQPEHKVTIESFWLQRTEVTNAQYAKCVAAKACTPPNNQRWQNPEFAQHPVTHVTWAQANAYAAWAGGRLPNEAEWERACRGTDGRLYPWGEEEPTSKLANYNNEIGDTTPVGSYPDGVSPYGALDMAGNVWEWTSSLEKPYPYNAKDGREDPKASGKRMLRGGSYYYTEYQLHCTTRSGFTPTTANQHFGFRVAMTNHIIEWKNPVDGAAYVYVPGGEFTMGAEEYEAASPLEQPEHKVTVSGFWLQRTEVTNAEYAKCVAAKACTPPNNQRWQKTEFAQHPVNNVSWNQANAYAAWAGGRLPSEAEWEKACRGTDGRLYPWGEEDPTSKLANYNNDVGDTTPVGSYPAGASPYGALDMAGNVWEWTLSIEKPYPYNAKDGREDPKAPGKRILRGGSYYYTQYQLHCTTRSGFTPTTANQHFGFRVIMAPGEGKQ